MNFFTKKIPTSTIVFILIFSALLLLIPIGNRYVEFRPIIIKLFLLYFVLFIMAQFIHFGYSIFKKYLYSKENLETHLTIAQIIGLIAYIIWSIMGIYLIVAVIMGNFEILPLLLLYIFANLILNIVLVILKY